MLPLPWNTYSKCFQMGAQSAMEYRVDFFIQLLSGALPMVIQCYLWTAIFRNSSTAVVFDYTYSQMIAYSILAILTSRVVAAGFESEISLDVKEGGLSKFVVQPFSHFYYRMFKFLGEKSIRIAVLVVINAIVIVLLRITLDFEWKPSALIGYVMVIPLSLFLNFAIYYCLSAISFWVIESWGIFATFTLLAGIASGSLFPIDVFSEPVQRVLDWLPFPYIIYFPVNILSGKVSGFGILSGMTIQLIWTAAFLGLSRLLWQAGMRRFEAVGG
ncbi:ABC-2 family transporter protein [Paenibacillus sp. HB172176]|uniref:ABC transporter permease n=1 Tax=Paenibacillus sp. HB172176 TaxID=2493690 RepID=UPI00143BD756|nr:ABC-2 family transporter protein [Paenibacillus sp. HB172176]